MLRQYIGVILLDLFLQCICTKEDLREIRNLSKKREQAAVWQPPPLKKTSPRDIFIEEHVNTSTESNASLWDSPALSSTRRALFIRKASRYARWNTRRLAEFNAHIPLSPSIETRPNSYFAERAICKSKCLGLQRWNRYRFDHPKACGGALTPVPKIPFRLLDLPLELRRDVYKWALKCDKQIWHCPPDASAASTNGPFDVRLLAVSKRVYEEAIEIFYQCNTFAIDVDHLPLFIQQGTGILPPRPIELLKHVHLGLCFKQIAYIGPTYITTHQDLESKLDWKPLLSKLHQCRNLAQVELTIYFAGIPVAAHKIASSLADLNGLFRDLEDHSQVWDPEVAFADHLNVYIGHPAPYQSQAELLRRIMERTSGGGEVQSSAGYG